MPVDYSKYPTDWKTVIRPRILERAQHRCEATPAFPNCHAANKTRHPETGSMVVLTIAHMDHDTTNNDDSNLKALCQRCHLNYDAAHHARNARRTRETRGGQMALL